MYSVRQDEQDILDFSLISQFPDETMKTNPAYQREKLCYFRCKNTLPYGTDSRFKAVSSPKAIVYVPFLQETEHNQLNPMNPVNPVENTYLTTLGLGQKQLTKWELLILRRNIKK